MGLRSGTEVLWATEQTGVGAAETEHTAPRETGDFSLSVLCLALTIPTGMEPAREDLSNTSWAVWGTFQCM